MTRKQLLSEAIADAKVVKETALANAKLSFKEGLKPKVVSYKAWDTLRSWIAELIIVDRNQIDITYSKRDKSEIRITIQNIDSNVFVDGHTADVYHLSKDDIGVAVLPERISKLLRDVWNQKELERSKHSVEYYTSKFISKHKY